MASLPQSQRRPSPAQRSGSPEASTSHALNRADSEVHSTISEDSQTILLNPSSRSGKQKATAEGESSQQSAAPQELQEPRKCWICFSDETEDTPTTSAWRSPCPCALEAHEQCLLDWIADMEAPNSRRQRSPSDKILCPQCKSEIQLARPKSYVVDAVKGIEILGSKLVLPGAITVGVSSFWYLCWVHGASSVMLVFGQEDGERILAPLLRQPPGPEESLQALLEHWRQRLRLDLGLFCIPSMLIFSRTSMADGILPILPILFFVTKPDSDPFTDIGTWPPSAGLSFALLPYLRGLYNTYYERVWGEHVKRWLKEIQPRAITEAQEENANNGNGDAANGHDDGDREGMLEINVDLAMLDEWDEEDDVQMPGQGPQQAHPLNDPPLDAMGGRAEEQAGIPAVAPAPDVPRHRHANGHAQQGGVVQPADAQPQHFVDRNNFNLAVSTNRLFESVLGALAFPTISAIMGELLRVVLPRSWTTLRTSWMGGTAKPTGLLQQKWGRSLVGGAVFVVLKDAVMLYVKWRMAKDHRMRRVLDYTGKTVRGRGGAAA